MTDHGTNAAYAGTARCRCTHCRQAHADYMREYREVQKRWERLGREVERLVSEARS